MQCLVRFEGSIKDPEVLLRDGFEQKIVVKVLPEWCANDESQVSSMNWLKYVAVRDLQSKQLDNSVLLECYL